MESDAREVVDDEMVDGDVVDAQQAVHSAVDAALPPHQEDLQRNQLRLQRALVGVIAFPRLITSKLIPFIKKKIQKKFHSKIKNKLTHQKNVIMFLILFEWIKFIIKTS